MTSHVYARAARSAGRRPTDVTLAGATTAISVALLLLMPLVAGLDDDLADDTPGPEGWVWWIAAACVLAQGVCLLWSSTRPRLVLSVVPLIAVMASLAPLGAIANITLVALVPATYVATRQRTSDQSWTPWLLALLLGSATGLLTTMRDPDATTVIAVGSAVLQALLLVGIPTAIAQGMRGRAAIYQAREREALARVHEHEARTEAAVAEERTAIARELHDIAAHHLSGIALMSAAISHQIDTDPAGAKAALHDVRTQTRTLLDELRGLVALLRQDDGASVEIQSIAALGPLVAAAKERGLDVALTVGSAKPADTAASDTPEATLETIAYRIGPLGQFAAYRTVQEALANAARHAPTARCQVSLSDTVDYLDIEVVNGPGVRAATDFTSRGFGLQGMTERAALTRSRLTYGPTEDQGWRVALRVPRETGPAAKDLGEDRA